jgi:amidase
MRAAGRLVVCIAALLLTVRAQAPDGVSVVEAGITDLRRAMDDGRTTSRALTEQYLTRLSRYNGAMKAAISINPQARAEADARDRERQTGRLRGPLHGVPIAIKDNIQVDGMPTTGGTLAFRDLRAPFEATLVGHLRTAGAVILAKTTLTELANWVSPRMPTGFNALLGFSLNPYDPRLRPGAWSPNAPPYVRGETPQVLPGGSSSGVGTALSLWAASVGTETSGSILNPSAETLLVGLKPTVGRISRHGVIPISLDQDTPGPMARTVADAAILLGAMEGRAPDPRDGATRVCAPPAARDYGRSLRPGTLKGARIGVPRAFFEGPRSGVRLGEAEVRLLHEALAALREAGATVVDPADLPSVVSAEREHNLLAWPMCTAGVIGPRADVCSSVLRYGMKRDFNRWLASIGPTAPVRTLGELRGWNNRHQGEGAIPFGQAQLDASDAVDVTRDRPRYERDLEKDHRLTRSEGIDAALTRHRLDALVFPNYYGASIGARAGYPSIIVPFPGRRGGTLTRFGVTFTGTACSEPRLLALAYGFEQATRRRVAPAS